MSPRARTLFALGPHYAYGALFNAAFSWNAAVTNPVLQKLYDARLIASPEEKEVGSSNHTLLISAHCRHWGVEQSGDENTALIMKTIDTILSKHTWKKCGILLASDRRKTGAVLEPLVRERGCILVTMTPKNTTTTSEPQKPEHGVDVGMVAMQDLYMLSLGDILISSFGSTFSFLAKYLVSARSYSREGRRAPSVFECDTFSGLCLRELPLISTNNENWWYTSIQGYPSASIRNSPAEICHQKKQRSMVNGRARKKAVRTQPQSRPGDRKKR
eukprot:gnl/TRDRNA2_/TRDRNA2_176576_c3_seq6.p1 gnl/TRDRNA2_/TRDRNA2_176576_c3~~gnl/TRDRNA2_/TRDRNA2_176576_c3_seq6.p1  ORF type:complete len:273 (-),score=14.61 gnl/TRDRNA2_/TRDRNA2_176576_c3_seq6:140-958(-)